MLVPFPWPTCVTHGGLQRPLEGSGCTFEMTGKAIYGRESLLSVEQQAYEATRMRTPYHTDFVAWAEETAQLLRQRRFDELDLEALVEEVEGLAKRDRKALRSQLQPLLVHLLTWHYLPNDLARTRGNWGTTITQARNEIADDLEDSPSLRSYPAAVLDRVYHRARREARDQSQLDLATFPAQCLWPIEYILADDWLPE